MPSSNADTVYFERNITAERSPQVLHSNQIMKNCLPANKLVPKAELQDLSLWTKFSDLQNEMIVTRGGRRMFPTFRVKLSDLYPDAMYCISMEIVNMDEYRYRYQNEKWTPVGRGEPHLNSNTYIHPLSPCSGAELMKQIISFHKVKLTNSYGNASGVKINVYSLHKYQLHLHITRCDDMCNSEHQLISTAFSETTFITVTAYQNLEVIKLKIENNPFARGFRSNGRKPNNKRHFLIEEENVLQELSMQQISISGQVSKRFMASVSEAHSPSAYQSIPQSIGLSNIPSTSLATQQRVSEAYSNGLARDNSRRIAKQVLFQQSSSASEQHPVAQQVTDFPSQSFDMSQAIRQHYISPMTQSIGSQNYGRLGYALYSNAASEAPINYSLTLAKSSVSNANSYPNYASESYVHNSSSAAEAFANSSTDDPRSFVQNSSSDLEASHCGTRCAERSFFQNSFTGSDAFFHMSTNVAEALPRR